MATFHAQRTAGTGQAFPPEAVDLVRGQTQGRLRLVNAIARPAAEKIPDRDWSKPVTAGLIREAIQALILRRDTHRDSPIEHLREDRVRAVVQPIILGEERALDMVSDDVRCGLDFGLICNDQGVDGWRASGSA